LDLVLTIGSGLDQERDKIRERQRFLGRVLTQPEKPRAKPFTCKKYYLRGIAASANVIFVCRRTPRPSQDLIEFDDGAGPQDQWWRLSYYGKDPEPVSAKVWFPETRQNVDMD